MEINYVAAAKDIMSGNVSAPVAIYDIAEKAGVGVLIAKIDENGKKESEYKTLKAVFLLSEFLKQVLGNLGKDFPKGVDTHTFSLILYTVNALEKRLIVAYCIALQYLYFKNIIPVKEVTDNAILHEIDTESISYRLALHILIPESSLIDVLRSNGISRQDAKKSSDILDELSQTFLVSKIDVENRLEMRSEVTEV